MNANPNLEGLTTSLEGGVVNKNNSNQARLGDIRHPVTQKLLRINARSQQLCDEGMSFFDALDKAREEIHN